MPEDNKSLVYECECCGGTFEKRKEGEYYCYHCGYVKYIETTTSGEIISLLNQANALRNKGEFDDACEIYQNVTIKDENNPEGYWGMFLCEYGIMHVQDPKSGKFVPTCNRASLTPITKDANLQKAIDLSSGAQKEDIKQKADQIEKIREKILTLSQNEQPYDVFICYKRTASIEDGRETYTEDAQQAREIYDILNGVGYKVFFAEKTLQNLAGSEYEPIIFNALNTSKVMLVVCSDPVYINAPWVKNEWRRFIKLMEYNEDKKLIPVMAGGMKAGRLPDHLKKFQGLEINVSFKDNLLESLKRCIDDKRSNGLERVTLSGVKTAKRSATINSNFQVRNLGSKQASNIEASDEKLVQLVFTYIEEGMLEDARGELDNLKAKRGWEKFVNFVQAYLNNNLNFSRDVAERFNECVPTVSSSIAEYLFKMLERSFQKDKSGTIYETLMSWDRPNKEELTKTLSEYIVVKARAGTPTNEYRCADKNNKEEVAISKIANDVTTREWGEISDKMEAIVRCFDSKNVEGYINLLTYWGVISSSAMVKNYCYSKILEVDEGNVAIRYQAYLDNIPGINKLTEQLLENDDEKARKFKAFLQYVDEKDRSKYIVKELDRVLENISAYPKTFINSVISLLPQSENKQVVKYLLAVAEKEQKQEKWDEAISYYQNALAEDEKSYKAYWGILLCKMKCVNDEATMSSTCRMDEFLPEFNSAVRLAPEDVARKYIALRKTQIAKAEQNLAEEKAIKAREEARIAEVKKLEEKQRKEKRAKLLLKIAPYLVGAVVIVLIVGFVLLKKYSPTFMATAISTPNELVQLMESAEPGENIGGKYYLADDIDLKDYPNVGFSNWFEGNFNGNGKTIYNYTVTEAYGTIDDQYRYVGLFARLSKGRVANITFKDVNINLGDKSYTGVGVVCGYNNEGEVSNIIVEGGSIHAPNCTEVGGIVGTGWASKITNSSANVTIVGGEEVGGIIGSLCKDDYAGNLTFSGSVTGGNKVGGIAGECVDWKAKSPSRIKDSKTTSTAEVYGKTRVGGIVGYVRSSYVDDCTNEATITVSTAGFYVGGIVGDYALELDREKITASNLINKGEIVSAEDAEEINSVGGIVGKSYSYNYACLTLSNCSNQANINVNGNYVGGMVGWAEGYKQSGKYYGEIEFLSCAQNGNVTGSDYIGMFIGYVNCGLFSYGESTISGVATGGESAQYVATTDAPWYGRWYNNQSRK